MFIEKPKKKELLGDLTTEKRKQLILIFVFGLFTLAVFLTINKIYGIYLFIFFITFVIFRSRSFILLASFLIAIVFLYTMAIDTIKTFKETDLSVIQQPGQSLANIFSPNSGQHVLPSQVQQMLSLLRAHSITSYRLTDPINQDELIRQRMVEAAWPIKMDEQSPYLFRILTKDETSPNCEVIDQTKEIALEFCH